MIDKVRTFLLTTILGGMIIILPIILLAVAFGLLFKFVMGLIKPITSVVLKTIGPSQMVAEFISLFFIVIMCFFIGVFVRTKAGQFFFNLLEKKILKITPGYSLFKGTIKQLLSGGKPLFSGVALVRLSDAEVTTTAFISDRHPDGSFTVFVPIGPTPTSGIIYHLRSQYVQLVEISVEEAMRTVITCGAGSTHLVEAGKRIKK